VYPVAPQTTRSCIRGGSVGVVFIAAPYPRDRGSGPGIVANITLESRILEPLVSVPRSVPMSLDDQSG
jgi:hypothetical protein